MCAHRSLSFRLLCLLTGLILCLLTAEAADAPTPPASRKPRTLIAKLDRGQSNQLWLEATIEGVKGAMIVDTGAGITVLTEEKYAFLRRGADRKLPAGVAATIHVNDLKTPVAMARNFLIGGIDLGETPAALVPQNELREGQSFYVRGRTGNFDGVLAEGFLRRYQAIIDCSRQLLYLDLAPSGQSTLAASLAANGWTRIPMTDLSNDFTVPCTLAGREYRLIVDTGASVTTLDQDLLDAAHVSATYLPFGSHVIGNQSRPALLVDMNRLQIGNYMAADVKMASVASLRRALRGKADDPVPILGLLGSDTLAFNGAIIDVGGHALYLKHPSANTKKP